MIDKELKKFNDVESKYNLLELGFNEIPLWELIRIDVFNSIMEKDGIINKNINPSNQIKLKNIFVLIKNIVFNNPFYCEKNAILILGHPRKKKIDGKSYKDIYTDFIPNLYENYSRFEGFVNYSKLHYPDGYKKKYYLDIIQILGRLGASFLTNHEKKSLRKKAKVLHNIFKKEFDLDIQFYSLLSAKYSRWKVSYRIVCKLTSKIKPKVIICVVSYSFMNQLFTFIARELNIRVIELQHGTIGAGHIAYNYPKNKNINDIKCFPTDLFCWSKIWVKSASIPLDDKRIKYTGFPYAEEKIHNVTNSNYIRQKEIVVISQYRVDIENITLRLSSELKDYKIFYKAHPSEYHTINDLVYKFKGCQNIFIIKDDKELYNIINTSKYIIGVNSTLLLEAKAINPNVLILKFPGWEYYKNYDELNLLFFQDVDELTHAIKNNVCAKNVTTDIYNKNGIFNFKEALDAIIKST